MLAAVGAKTPSDGAKPVGMDGGSNPGGNGQRSEQEVLDEVSRSALAYQKQLLARDLSSGDAMAAEKMASKSFPKPFSNPFSEARKSLPKQTAVESPRVLATQVSYPNTEAAALPAVSKKLNSPPDSTTTTIKILPSPESQKNATAEREPLQRVSQVAYSSSEPLPTPMPMSDGISSLQDELERTITAWEQSTSHQPGSTQEVQQHMRLRLLYLLAGREDSMLESVPGATPVQQDYWSNQLFALSTFLDSEHQPRDKQRAAAALMHLDKAREKLAEIGPLQIRNLAFVESVDGYGLYRPLSKQMFRPGQQVTLYAEVENFHSESTEKGQRSSLGTSYQVLDQQGHRVDAGQFPEVEDLCQYGIALPTRIYPGKYELRLIVTDNLSNKLGQTSIPFEIVETALR